MRIQFVSILCTQQSARVQGHRINYTIQKKKKKEKIKAALLFVPLPVSLPIQITQGEIILLSDQLHALVLL